MLRIAIGKDLSNENFSIQFNDGHNILGNAYPYPDDFTPYPAVEIPLEHLKEYRDFIDRIIKENEGNI